MRLSRERDGATSPTARARRSDRRASRPGNPTERPLRRRHLPTMGTTRTIGTPAPAYAGGQVAQGGTLGLLGNQSVMNVPVQHDELHLAADREPAGADGGGYADQRCFGPGHHRAERVRRHASDPRLPRWPRATSASTVCTGLFRPIASRPDRRADRTALGPGALINGIAPGGSVGGGVNIVTKRAGEIPFTRVTPFFMSAGSYGVHLENSGRYGANKEWGVRFNGVGRNGEASIDGGNWRTGLGALGVDYRGERFRWTLDAISQNDDTRNFRPQMGIQTTVPFIPAVPDARSNWYPGTTLKQRDNTIATAAEYDISEALTAYAGDRLSRRRELPDFPGFSRHRLPRRHGPVRQFQAHQCLLRFLQQDDERQRGHAIAFPDRGRRSRGQRRFHRLLPGERQRLCRQHADPVGAVEHLQPVTASGGNRRAPAAAEGQRDHVQERGDCGHDVVPERVGALHRRCSSPEGGAGYLQHHHRSADEQLRSGSGDAARRHCRQAVAERLAVRELCRRTEPGHHRSRPDFRKPG